MHRRISRCSSRGYHSHDARSTAVIVRLLSMSEALPPCNEVLLNLYKFIVILLNIQMMAIKNIAMPIMVDGTSILILQLNEYTP